VSPRALPLTGTVGVGRTTVAAAVGDLLREREVANAVVDLDELRRAWPSPPGDRFATSVLLANLSAVAANHVGHGFSILVPAGISGDGRGPGPARGGGAGAAAGRRHAYERLDHRRTVPVVVDLVSFFLEEMPHARGIVPRVNAVATALRPDGQASGSGGVSAPSRSSRSAHASSGATSKTAWSIPACRSPISA
jgi:hypothetical protein